jgi:hypothetical protein
VAAAERRRRRGIARNCHPAPTPLREVGEHATLSNPVTINLASLFEPTLFNVHACTDMLLSGSVPKTATENENENENENEEDNCTVTIPALATATFKLVVN